MSEKPVIEEWLRKVLDIMAKELLEINKNRNNLSPDLLKLQCVLFLSRLKEIGHKIEDNRIAYMKSQIEEILTGGAINEGKISDMRFSSLFTSEIVKKEKKPVYIRKQEEKKLPEIKIKEKPVNYSFNNNGKERNELQEKIINTYPKRFCQETIDYVKTVKDEDFLYKDIDGNTSLHLAAYCGSDSIIKEILNHFSIKPELQDLIMMENKYKETAVTLAIKKRGFYDSLKLLTGAGGYIKPERVEPFQNWRR